MKNDNKSNRKSASGKSRRQNEPSAGSDNDTDGQLVSQLAALGLAPKDVLGDGNCLFRALGDQLEGRPENHAKWRAATIIHMRKNEDLYAPFLDMDVDARLGKKQKAKMKGTTGDERVSTGFAAYLTRMGKDGVYAGNLELVAFSRLSKRDIVVHQAGQAPWVIHCSDDNKEEKSGPALHVVYLDYEHYQSVKAIGGHERPGVDVQSTSKKDQKIGSKGRKKLFSETYEDEYREEEGQEKEGEAAETEYRTDEIPSVPETETLDVTSLISTYTDQPSPSPSATNHQKEPEPNEDQDPAPNPGPKPQPTKPPPKPSKAQLKELKKRAQKAASLEKKREKTSGGKEGSGGGGKGAADEVDIIVGGLKAVVI